MEVLVRIKRLAVARRESHVCGHLGYTKGTIRRKGGQEVFYVFVSAKLAV